jgi:5-methylcytosine-specific restriction endonuclease McrA
MLSQRPVLVLNKSWQAIGVVTLEKALKKVFAEVDGEPKAKIIDCTDFQRMTWEDWSKLRPAEGEEGIRTVNAILRIPEVIQVTKYDKIPVPKVHFCRKTLFKRDAYACQYCGDQPGSELLSIDHVIPKSKGGLTTWENCVTACTTCNHRKGNRLLAECGMKLRKQPIKPKHNLVFGDVRVTSWENFLSQSYWLTELENDN